MFFNEWSSIPYILVHLHSLLEPLVGVSWVFHCSGREIVDRLDSFLFQGSQVVLLQYLVVVLVKPEA